MYTFSITRPTYEKYHELYEQHRETLTCPCSQISNRHQSFITIDHSLHTVCSSVYITDQWIIELWSSIGNIVLYLSDFRFSGVQMFLALKSFCQLADESIKMSLDQFYFTGYVSAVVTSEELLQSQLETIIEQFIASTTNNFLLTLRMIGNTTQANALLSSSFTNFVIRRPNTYSFVYPEWMIYDNQCSCASFSGCSRAAVIYLNDSLSSPWIVPGFHIGCYVLEALRRSDLRCFFDQTCLDEFRTHFELMPSTPLPMLALSSLSNFEADTLLGTIIDQLFVDQWKWTINHTKYYNVCKPNYCRYTVLRRNDAIGLVTVMFGLLGGLVEVERFIIPKVVNMVMKCSRKKQNRIVHPSDLSTASPSSSA